MFSWLSNNFGTIIVCIILTITVALIIVKMIKDRKSGKHSCGCDCANCSACNCSGRH